MEVRTAKISSISGTIESSRCTSGWNISRSKITISFYSSGEHQQHPLPKLKWAQGRWHEWFSIMMLLPAQFFILCWVKTKCGMIPNMSTNRVILEMEGIWGYSRVNGSYIISQFQHPYSLFLHKHALSAGAIWPQQRYWQHVTSWNHRRHIGSIYVLYIKKVIECQRFLQFDDGWKCAGHVPQLTLKRCMLLWFILWAINCSNSCEIAQLIFTWN